MEFIGRLHPLLIHFPIALVIAAVLAEIAATVSSKERWRTVAIGNVRAGAAFALVATLAGWRLAMAPGMESSLLEWHRWLGATAAGVTLVAAFATGGLRHRSALRIRIYQTALFTAGILVAVAGHFGGMLVWGTSFLRP